MECCASTRSFGCQAVKELHYFDKPEVRRGCERLNDWPRIAFVGLKSLDPWLFRYFFGLRSDAWYRRLFEKAQARGLITGEVTPAYATLGEDVFGRIKDMNPGVKLVFIMRDPVDRAWSAANLAAKSGYIAGPLTEEKALKRAHSSGWVARSSYLETIRRLERLFPASQLHYCFFDDLRDRPKELAAGIFAFLGVDATKVSEMNLPGAVNAAAAGTTIPTHFELTMAREYLPMVRELCARFEGAPHVWRARYEALLNS